MQNNNKSNGFRRFVKEKGYYIVLLLCAVAIGVSGYFLLTNNKQEPSQEVHLSATEPSGGTQSPASIGKNPAGPTADVVATDGVQSTEPSESQGKPASMKIQAPVDGEPINVFAADFLAYNETTRDWRTHEGLDLSAALGDEVKAAADGTVYTIYESEGLGTTVVLRHSNGYTTQYSNLAEDVSVSVGDSVSAGQTLGTVGQTAGVEFAEEPHLHFAVYLNNVPVDPSEFLKLS